MINAKVAVWVATTDGDNCPLTTTLHYSEKEARARVISDMRASAGQSTEKFERYDTEALCVAWEHMMDGACIIERHVVKGELTS